MSDNEAPKRSSRRSTRGRVRQFGVGGGQQQDHEIPEIDKGENLDDRQPVSDTFRREKPDPEKTETVGKLKVNPLQKPKNSDDVFMIRGTIKGNPRVLTPPNLERGTAFCRFNIDVGTTRPRVDTVFGPLPLDKEGGEFTNKLRIKDTDRIEFVAYMKPFRGEFSVSMKSPNITFLPSKNENGIKKYLMSFNGENLGLSQGVGEVSAQKFYEKYEDDLTKLNNPKNLTDIGWPAEVAERVSQKAKEGERFRDLRIELEYTFGMKRSQVDNLINVYGSKLDSILEKDPWSLGIRNISFQILDRIAANRGAPMDSTNRVRAGVAKYIRDMIADTGSTCIPIGAILDEDIVAEPKKVVSSRARRLRSIQGNSEPVKAVSDKVLKERQEAKDTLNKLMRALDRSKSSSDEGKAADRGNINIKVIREAIDYLLSDECLEKAKHNALKIYKVDGQAYLYPVETFEKEKSLADKIAAISVLPKKHLPEEAEKAVDEVSKNKGIKLSDEQRDAAINACVYPMCVITGGAGTGKSTIQDIVCSAIVHMGSRVSLSAPTGKAAKRLAQTTKRPATTIHKQLDFGQVSEGEYDFRRNWSNPIEEEAVITDEGSMEDMDLANHHFDAFPINGSMCIVGDYNQLSSVGAGQVLKDIINTNNENIKVCRLTQTRRSSDDSNLMIGAHKVNRGEDPFANGNVRGIRFIDCDDNDISRKIAELQSSDAASKGLDYKDGYTSLSPIRATSKENSGERKLVMGSVPELNRTMKVVHNPNKNTTESTIGFSVGDVVIGTKNNYSLDFRNGEEGIVVAIDQNPKSPKVMVSFDGGNPVPLTRDDGLKDIELAYANTVHKFQGSEKDVVYVAIPRNRIAERIMTRNLLYTMFTRASKEIVLVGDRNQFKAALKREEGRTTNLTSMINDRIAELEAMPYADRVKNNRYFKRLLEHRKEIYPPGALDGIEEALIKEGVDLDGLSSMKTEVDNDGIEFDPEDFDYGM